MSRVVEDEPGYHVRGDGDEREDVLNLTSSLFQDRMPLMQ